MSAVDTTQAPEANTNGSSPVAEAERTRHDIFKYAEWVHLGDGVEECELTVALADEHRDRSKALPVCGDPDHFHAWCRLPNPFQIRDIAEKARAARARRIRLLKDPDSDPHVILEQELDALRDPASRPILIEEIVDQEFVQDYGDAVKAVRDMEVEDWEPEEDKDDQERPKLYENVEQDTEEYQRQSKLPEEQRGEDWPELEKTVTAYSRAVNEQLDAIQEPKKEALAQKTEDELIEIVRRLRIDAHATEAYLHTYNTWQWFVCTYKPAKTGYPSERVWRDISEFKFQTPPDVVGAIQMTFTDLEQRLAGEKAGNS